MSFIQGKLKGNKNVWRRVYKYKDRDHKVINREKE